MTMINIKKQAGFTITSEMVLLATIVYIGSIAGLVVVRDALVEELFDVAKTIRINEQYAFDGVKKNQQVVQDNSIIAVPSSIGESND